MKWTGVVKYRVSSIVGILVAGACGALIALSARSERAAVAQPMTDRISTPTLATSTDYQPDLTDAEAAQAVMIARSSESSSIAAGDRIGHALLAYPPGGEEPFFADRIVYVTFHENELADPSSGMWVSVMGPI